MLDLLTKYAGKFVVAAIKSGPKVLGKQILAATDYYTPSQIISNFEEVTGHKARFISVDADTYKSFLPAPMADELLENHLFIDSPGYYAGRDLGESLKLVADAGLRLTTFKEFLQKNKDVFVNT